MDKIIETLLGLDPGQLAGADSWAPHFRAQYNNWIVLGLVVVLAALAALTVISYLREGETPRRAKLTLAAVRIVVILLVLAMLFQPELLLTKKKELYSTLVVLVDDSFSMARKDHYADASLREAVAGKVGVRPEELADLTRMDLVRKVLLRQGGPLAQLAKDHPMVLLRFSTSVSPGDATYAYVRALSVLDQTQDAPDAAVAEASRVIGQATSGLQADGDVTNLASALRSAADRLRGGSVAGIVLVSDGQATRGDLNSALAHIRQRNLPVYAVAVGDPVPPQSAAVLNVQAPKKVHKGSTIEFTAHLSNRNCGGQVAQLLLLRKVAGEDAWSDTGVSAEVKLVGEPGSAQSEPQEVALKVEAADKGDYEYRVQLKPMSGEFAVEDKTLPAKVSISDEPVKILLVSGDAGWEFQYLRNLLLRNVDHYGVSVWQQDAEREFNQEASSEGMKLTQLPRTSKELFGYDVVILYDPLYTEGGFDKPFVDLLKEFVQQHFGGVCYVVSNKNSDILLGPGVSEANDPFKSLRDLLPVVLDRQSLNQAITENISQGEPVAWRIRPVPSEMEHPILRLTSDAQENANLWNILPGIYWSHPVYKLKDAATDLAVSGDELRRLSSDSSKLCPVLAVQYFGRGRSLYVGTDEMWRWRIVADALYYRHFWTNVVDFLSAGRLEKKRCLITTGAERFGVGDKIHLRAEVYDRDYQPVGQEQFVVDMADTATGKTTPITLVAKGAKGHYEKVETLTGIGTFRLTAGADQGIDKVDVDEKTIVVTRPEEEELHPEADLLTLETIAPEGRCLTLPEADRLAEGELIPPGHKTVFNPPEGVDLWDKPAVIVVIVLLLAVEWILRKRYNMA